MRTTKIKIPPFNSLPLLKGGRGRDFLVSITIVTLFILPVFAFSQTTIEYVPLAPIPNTTITEAGKTTTSLPTYLTGLYKSGIAAAGILAVLMLVWGGFQYMTTEAVSGKSESKGIIMNVIWGLATVLASYLLLYTINPRLVDIGLALQNLNPVTKTRIPSAAENYGKFLDDALRRAQNIATEARDLKIAGDAVEGRIKEINRKFREGDFTPEEIADNMTALNEELDTLIPKLPELRKKEGAVRNYKNTDDFLSTARGQINQCLQGLGRCSEIKVNKSSVLGAFLTGGSLEILTGIPPFIEVTYDDKASKDVAKNNAAAQQIVQSARAEVNAHKTALIQTGLTEQANALEQKMTNIENSTAFYIRCPNSQVTYVPGKGYESGSCP